MIKFRRSELRARNEAEKKLQGELGAQIHKLREQVRESYVICFPSHYLTCPDNDRERRVNANNHELDCHVKDFSPDAVTIKGEDSRALVKT